MPIAVGNITDGSSRAGKTCEHGITALLEPEYVESQFKTIIADVLQMDLDGLDETQSLKLGGDSILAIKVMARCRAKGIPLSVADMIDARNIADLCQRVSQSAPGPFLNGNDAYLAAPNEQHREHSFYNVCGDVSEGEGIAGGSSHTTSLFRTRFFPFEDDGRLLRRVQGCTRADFYSDDEVVSQQEPNVLTSDSNFDDNIIVVDVRQLRQHRGGEECPVGPVSKDFLSDVELNLDDSLHLSILLRSTNNEISCLLSRNVYGMPTTTSAISSTYSALH